MLHDIQVDQVGARGQVMADAVSSCVHCGFCLTACPTYTELGEEMESPRGRILLMKSVLEGSLTHEQATLHLDRCLGCLSCEPACPSGVPYGQLLTSFRAWQEALRTRSMRNRMIRWTLLHSLPYPWRSRLAFLLGRWAKPVAKFLPDGLAAPLALLPRRLPPRQRMPRLFSAKGEKRARVALLTGCVQQVLAPEISLATARVLASNGVEVLVPQAQSCCGALAAHTGAMRRAIRSATGNLNRFPSDIDAIITSAAGCGSGIREYPIWFENHERQQEATAFAGKCVDVCKFLADIGMRPPKGFATERGVAYHDACHLAGAQNITAEPRELLQQVPNLSVLEIVGGPSCCGSAGTYNLEQPELARKFGAAKARAVIDTGADVVCTGNLGCMVQLSSSLAALSATVQVLHTVQLLDEAYH